MTGKITCLNCGCEKIRGRNTHGKYCSNFCQQQFQIKDRASKWLGGKVYSDNRTLRSILILLRGNQCEICKITKWNDKEIVFEVEHINGDSGDSSPENVCLICPNCHSQTLTYKGANKGNGRHYRRLRYAQGKSY